MGWINALYETYQDIESIAGEVGEDGSILFPVGHVTVKAQVEVTISSQGDFIKAEKIPKDDALTLIPVTEDSATRSSGVAPHPLNDKLCYIAGDYDDFVKPKKSKAEYYAQYMGQLTTWEKSPYTDEKITALHTYLAKGRLMQDLVQCGILERDENGILAKAKIADVAQEDAFLRFKIWKAGAIPGQYIPETWLDTGLHQKYIDFYGASGQQSGLCYVTGDEQIITTKHPNKIRNAGDKAKIISSNDSNTNSLTFRGRFKDPMESVALGYEVSQKAHSALRWLIERQGYRNGTEAVVTWASEALEEMIPQPLTGTDAFFGGIGVSKKEINTAQRFAVEFNKAIAGYHGKLDTCRKIVVMAVDTADGSQQGRLAITYYQELAGSQYLENLTRWHTHGRWTLRLWDDEKEAYYDFVGVPSPKEMALAAFGVEREEKNQKKLGMNDKLMKATIQRILPCIAGGMNFPKDLMLAAVRNAGHPMTMSLGNWTRVSNNACSMICLYYYTQKREELSMGLDYECKDRSYLFGRMLAVANYAEEQTYDEDDKKRVSNARRYWNVFSGKPGRTWKIIYENLTPYFDKLDQGKRGYINKVLGEITDKMTPSMMMDERALSPLYLLGFQHQNSVLWMSKAEKEKLEKEGM